MLTQLILAKRMYLEARSMAASRDAVAAGMSISLLQDAVELYLWTLIKERSLPAKDQAGFVSHLECIQKAGIAVPGAAKLLELNKARIGFKHYGNLPAASEQGKFLTYVEEFFGSALPAHFGLDFGKISLVDLVSNAQVREHLRLAEERIIATKYQEAAGELAKAKSLLFAALHRYIPQVDHNLRDADRALNAIDGVRGANAFSYLTEYLGAMREYALVSLLRLPLQDYLFLRTSLPHANRAMSGQWYLNCNRGNYTAEECDRALTCIVNLSIQLQAFE